MNDCERTAKLLLGVFNFLFVEEKRKIGNCGGKAHMTEGAVEEMFVVFASVSGKPPATFFGD